MKVALKNRIAVLLKIFKLNWFKFNFEPKQTTLKQRKGKKGSTKKMKNLMKKFLLVGALLAVAQISVFAQTTAYTITDNGDDPTLPQRLYGFNINTGAIVTPPYPRDIDTVANRGNEYEGLASIGSVLYGVAENPDGTSTGGASDLRIFGPRRTIINNSAGLPIGVTGINFGTEIGAAYNAQDGYIYVVASDDTTAPNVTATRLYRLSPTDGGTVEFAAGVSFRTVTSVGGDTTPYLDGLAINASGLALATESQVGSDGIRDASSQGGLYALNISTGAGRYCGDLFTTDIRLDTGASFVGSSTQMAVLTEDGRLYNVNSANCTAAAATVTDNRATLRTTINASAGTGDFEGLDIPALTIR